MSDSESPTGAVLPRELEPAPVHDRLMLVLDTSVLVHDPLCLKTFRDVDVVIPVFVVMELDDLKTSNRHQVAAAARIVSRFLSTLMSEGEGNLHDEDGVVDPETGTRFRITANGGGHGLNALKETTGVRKMDILILSAATALKRAKPNRKVKLLSKDVNLRILANFEGVDAEDYDKDRVEVHAAEAGYRYVEEFDAALVQTAYTPDTLLHAVDVGIENLVPNEFVVFHDAAEEKDILLRYRVDDGSLRPVAREFSRTAGVSARNIEQRMALDLLMDPDVQLVSLIGKAGTGKTFLALATAMAQLGVHGQEGYERILLSKPVIPMGKDIGFLPGDFDAKMQPWMMSFFDNLDQLMPTDNDGGLSKGASRAERPWEYLFDTGQLEVQAIHSIRGRSIPHAFMLIDEAQNLTPHEVKTIITRAASGTKVILSGDPFQVDNHFLDAATNGLVYVTEKLKDSPMTGVVRFTTGERSPLAELAATLL